MMKILDTARQLADRRLPIVWEDTASVVVVGTGAPCAAAMLAQKTTAPKLTLMFEAGGVSPPPLSTIVPA